MQTTKEIQDLMFNNHEEMAALEQETGNPNLVDNEFCHKEFYMKIIKSWNARRPHLLSYIIY